LPDRTLYFCDVPRSFFEEFLDSASCGMHRKFDASSLIATIGHGRRTRLARLEISVLDVFALPCTERGFAVHEVGRLIQLMKRDADVMREIAAPNCRLTAKLESKDTRRTAG
jgi:hypothetical protein